MATPITPKSQLRQQVGEILEKYSMKVVLDGLDDTMLEALFKVHYLPLNLTSLKQAKEVAQEKTGMSPEVLGMTQQHQEQIWNLCQEFAKHLRE